MPQVPGVPALVSYAPPVALTVLVADAVGFLSSFFGPQWGIFFAGLPVVAADNVLTMEFKQEWNISQYPLEQGAFESYDRVQLPFTAQLRFSAGGAAIDRAALIASINALTIGTTVYDVVTPEAVYPSVSISHIDYRRSAHDGVGLLKIDVWVTQISVTTATQFSNTQAPSGSDPQGGGTVQPLQPSAAQSGGLGSVQ